MLRIAALYVLTLVLTTLIGGLQQEAGLVPSFSLPFMIAYRVIAAVIAVLMVLIRRDLFLSTLTERTEDDNDRQTADP